MPLTSETRIGLSGAVVVGVAFGMARYAFGLTLPAIRSDLQLGQATLGLIASGSFVGYLASLLCVRTVASRRGPRAPTTLGGVFGASGCLLVAVSQTTFWLAVGAVVAGSAAGWVWSPYSEVVARAAPPARHRSLLAVITTGTSGGLVLVGLLDWVAPDAAWRVVWLGTAVAAAASVVLNLWWVPRLGPRDRPVPTAVVRPRTAWRLSWPMAYAAVYTVTSVVYFTYASQAARAAGMTPGTGAVIFALIGIAGLSGLMTDRMAQIVGLRGLTALSLASIGLALVLLALSSGPVWSVLCSAAVFGAGYMTAASCLSIWVAELNPGMESEAFTRVLLVGAGASVITPLITGPLLEQVSLVLVLLLTGALGLLVSTALIAAPASRRHPS